MFYLLQVIWIWLAFQIYLDKKLELAYKKIQYSTWNTIVVSTSCNRFMQKTFGLAFEWKWIFNSKWFYYTYL